MLRTKQYCSKNVRNSYSKYLNLDNDNAAFAHKKSKQKLNITASSSRTPLSHEVQTKVSPHNGRINKVPVNNIEFLYKEMHPLGGWVRTTFGILITLSI